MPLYYWQGVTASGSSTGSMVIATNRNDACAQLRAQNITPLSIKRSLLPSKRQLNQHLASLLAQLAWLLQAHVPLTLALQQLPLAATHPSAKQFALQLQQRIIAGQSLADAIRPLTDGLAPEYHAFIAAGEASGRLGDLLTEVCRQQEQQHALWQRIKQALRYPLLLLLSAVGMCVAMLVWIVPHYSQFLAEMQAPLPPLTLSILHLTQGLQRYAGSAFLVTVICFGLWLRWRKHPAVILACHRTLLHIPLLGSLLHQCQLYRWCYLMAACSSTALPLLERLAIAQRGLHNKVLQQRFIHVHLAVLQGLPLHVCLRQCRSFKEYDLALITLGEQSATLTQVFESLANHYYRTILQTLTTLTAWLEPILLLCLGGVTALMLVAFYQPMIHLGLHL